MLTYNSKERLVLKRLASAIGLEDLNQKLKNQLAGVTLDLNLAKVLTSSAPFTKEKLLANTDLLLLLKSKANLFTVKTNL